MIYQSNLVMMMSNSSNFSNSNQSFLQPTKGQAIVVSWLTVVNNFLQILYFPLNSYFMPLLVVLCLFNNPLCLAVFFFSKDFYGTSSKNARLYYMTLAVADIICIIGIPLDWFLGDGLYGLTGGTFYIYFDIISPVWCSVWRYFYNFPESIVSWTMVCLNTDRLINLTWPFWARRYLTEKNTCFIIITIVVCAAALSVLVIFCYAISPTVATKVGLSCIGTSRGTTWYYILSPWALGIIGLLGPTFTMLALIILLFRKVLAIRRGEILGGFGEKRSIGRGSGSESRQGNETIAIVLTMSICHFIVYNPFPILWTLRASLGYLFNSDLYNLIAVLQRLVLDFSEIVHVWNIVFYLQITSFRHAVLTYLTCGYYKSVRKNRLVQTQ